MNAPPVQYVKTSDGYDIAYAVSGKGEPLVIAATGIDHVQLAWDFPDLGDFLRALAERYRLIQLDIHGAGMSSRGLPDDLTMHDFQPDLEAVIDHLKLERFLLYGAVYQSYVAVEYAVRNPEKVTALILANVGSTFDSYRAPALYEHVMEQDWDLFVHSMFSAVEPGGMPAEVGRQAEDIFKQAYKQADLVKLARLSLRSPMGPLLEQLRAPTLVLHSRDFGLLAAEEAMKTARLAKARFATIQGWNAYSHPGDLLAAIDSFLADLPSAQEPEVEVGGLPFDLSSREMEVLRLIAQGKSNPEIARVLFITRNTVQNHVSSILIKLNLSNRAQAAVYASEHGIV